MARRYNRIKTDDLFKMLPIRIRYRAGEFIGEYNLIITKANDAGVVITYSKNTDESFIWLDQYRKGPTLRDAIIETLEWLEENKYTEVEE